MGDRWFGDSEIGERFPAWTRGNAADVFPEPFSPLGQDLILRQGMCTGLRDGYIVIGAMAYDEYENPHRPELFGVFGGYVYNPLSMTRVFGARMPGGSPEMIDQAFFDEGADVPPYEYQQWHDSDTAEAKLGEALGWAMSADSLPDLDADRELARQLREGRPDLSTATDAALLARARAMVPFVQQTFENAMIVSTLSAVGTGAIGAICEAVGQPTAAIGLLAGIEVDSSAPSHAMWELGRVAQSSAVVSAAFDAGVDDLLERLHADGSDEAQDFIDRFTTFLFDHGSRGQNEYDPRASSWEIRPRIALAAIDLMRRSDDAQAPSVRGDEQIAERDRLVAEIRAKIADDAEAAGTFEAGLQSAQVFLAGRERAKTNVVRVINEARVALYEYADRLVAKGVIDDPAQLFMVTEPELDSLRATPDAFADTIAERWSTYQELFELEPLYVVNGEPPALADIPRRDVSDVAVAAVGDVLTGASGSGGSASGRAYVVHDAADPLGFGPGDVLVAPQTDPSWVPLMVVASAVVVNVGAQGSHAMIVSRELGIPCVVAVADGTRMIPDGATVTVDGTAGTVTIDALP